MSANAGWWCVHYRDPRQHPTCHAGVHFCNVLGTNSPCQRHNIASYCEHREWEIVDDILDRLGHERRREVRLVIKAIIRYRRTDLRRASGNMKCPVCRGATLQWSWQQPRSLLAWCHDKTCIRIMR